MSLKYHFAACLIVCIAGVAVVAWMLAEMGRVVQ